MGKMKTTVISGQVEETKTSADKYAEKKAKKALQNQGSKKEETTNEPQVKNEEIQPEEEIKQTKSIKSEPQQQKIRGKKYQEVKRKFSNTNTYKLEEAIKLVKEISYSKFDGTMELHLTVKKQGLNVQVALPHSTGKQKKIEVATEKTLEDLKNGKINFDILLATPEMMPKLATFARMLGPKGLMPNPKNGTVIKNEKEAEKFNANNITIKTEREQPLIHTSFGKVSQKNEELVTNAESIISALGGSKQITKAFMKSTMSPSIKLNI
jgi:large subunit ribosomal protein L1